MTLAARARGPLLALLLVAGCAGASLEARDEALAERGRPTLDGVLMDEYLEQRVVLVTCDVLAEGDDALRFDGMGTAAAVTTDGYLLTAGHLADADVDEALYPWLWMAPGPEQARPARVVWRARDQDLALLHVPRLELSGAFAVRAPCAADVSTSVWCAGFPRTLHARPSAGEVVAVERIAGALGEPDTLVVDHTAPLRKGDSGGPLVDVAGRLLGVNVEVSWMPFEGWRSRALLPDPAWLEARIAADRAARER